jgi:hypothetical protein
MALEAQCANDPLFLPGRQLRKHGGMVGDFTLE